MAKCPFNNFFDVYGNGQTDFSEELLAIKVLEDALPAEESVPCDSVADDSLDIPGKPEKAAYLAFSVESREERFDKRGIRRENYPTQRAYDAACDLIELQNGVGFVPSDSTRQREIERRRFMVEGCCAAARYLTISWGFLYAQAVKKNF